MGLSKSLEKIAKNQPDHPAIEDGDRLITYSDLIRQVDNTAANLWAKGVRPGHLIAVSLPDSAEHLILICALCRLGAVLWALDIGIKPLQMAEALIEFQAEAVITSRGTNITGAKQFFLDDLVREGQQSFDQTELEDTEKFALIQSSGTTGKPKAFYFTRGQMAETYRHYDQSETWKGEDRRLIFLRMCLNSGRLAHHRGLLSGGTILINRVETMDELVTFVRDRHVSYMGMIPAQLSALVDFARGKPMLFPNVEAITTFSATISPELRRLARQRVTPNIVERFATNECGLIAAATPSNQDAYPDSVGKIPKGTQVQIVDEQDNKLPNGEVGLLRIKTTRQPDCYLNDPEGTQSHFRDGWFYPNDLAAVNDEGFLFFKGRADDVINKSGIKFYPVEVETVIKQFPAVADAAVIGWPDEKHGEVAAAFVCLEKESELPRLREFLASKLTSYMRPKYLLSVEEMPYNPGGKTKKKELRALLKKRLAERGND